MYECVVNKVVQEEEGKVRWSEDFRSFGNTFIEEI
jgi:hypothetical protein